MLRRLEQRVHPFLAAKRLARELRAWKADLLHCHLPIAGFVGRITGRTALVPVVYTAHNLNLLERYHPITRRMNFASWKWQEPVVAVSSDVAAPLRPPARPTIQIQLKHYKAASRRFTGSNRSRSVMDSEAGDGDFS